jgi:molybdopterin synthase catalytic subunit
MLIVDPLVEVVSTPLNLQKYYSACEDPSCGAIVTFSGVTRNSFQGKQTIKLEYEAFVPMAEKKLKVGPKPVCARSSHRCSSQDLAVLLLLLCC